MNMNYLFKPTGSWVTRFFLAGCILITIGIVMLAYRTETIGTSFSNSDAISEALKY